MKKQIHIMDVPFALGSHRRGCDLGPKAIGYAGLKDVLQEKGYLLQHTEVSVTHKEETKEPSLLNLESVINTCESLAKTVDNTLKIGQFPLVIGGDHSIALGTVAGVAKHYENLGVIWIDAHGDANTDKTTPSGNIHGMILAASLGYGDSRLTHFYGEKGKVKPEHVAILGARDLDEGEIKFLQEQNIFYRSTEEMREKGVENVMKEVFHHFSEHGVQHVHVSFDMDSLDPSVVEGVGTPVEKGFSYREAVNILHHIKGTKQMVSAEFVETNPLLDDKNNTAKIAVSLVNELL